MLISVGIILSLVNNASAQRESSRVPYKLSDNFETGELFGWEPFPYNQDEGYDALYFARKSPTHNNSKYALARPVRANESAELSHGFTKKLNMWTTADTRIRAAVYLQSDRNAGKLELSLGTFDGRRYMYTVKNPEANRWLELDIPLGDFKLNNTSLAANEHIQVITLEGSYPIVYYLNNYTILLDDFEINGQRERRFVADDPSSTHFEMFNVSVLNKHFFYGDHISLKTSAEDNSALSKVRATLIDSRGKIVRDNIPFSHSDGFWVNESIYKLTGKDARGQWEIRLKGEDDEGKTASWSFKFLMPGNKVNSHPRLFFSANELKSRIENEKSPVAKKILEKALQNTNFMRVNVDAITEREDNTGEALSAGPYSPSASEATGWRTTIDVLCRVIEAGSFRFAFTGDAAAGEKAKQALVKLCSFSKWNNSWMLDRKFWTYYPVGETVARVAYGYDMLFSILSDEERKMIRLAIMEKGLKLFQRDMVDMNRMPSNNSNHIAVIVAGHALAATAIYGDDPQHPYLEPYLSGIITKGKAFIDRAYYEDGSYAEPNNGYLHMATMALAEMLPALERNFGIDYSTTTNVQHFYKYILHATNSNSRTQDYGYSHASAHMQDFGDDWDYGSLGRQLHSQWFVHRTGNPLLYSYVKRHWEAGNGGYFGYLWFRDDLTPSSRETLPLSRVFSADGMIMRSGWDSTSTVITTHVGPNANHAHYDQGSVQIMTQGEFLLTDPGVGTDGYYNNLDYPMYNIQAIGHNVMLLDRDPQSQAPAHLDNGIAALREWPRMVHTFAGNIADALESDLTSVYRDKLDTYSRTLLYNKSGPLFLFDRVKSKSADGHVYDWLFHSAQHNGKRSISFSNPRVTIDRPNARLTLDVVSPEISSGRIRDNTMDNESFVSLSSKKLNEANFLAVIMPEARPLNGIYPSRPVTTKVDAPGWIGAKVERPDWVDYGFFRTDLNASDTIDRFVTDAKQFSASFDGSGELVKAYFEGRTFFGSSLSVECENPVTCAVAIGAAGTQLEVKAEKAGFLVLSFDRKPAAVILNKSPAGKWKYDAVSKKLTLQVPAGRHDLSIHRNR
jgi:hypothetical protein